MKSNSSLLEINQKEVKDVMPCIPCCFLSFPGLIFTVFNFKSAAEKTDFVCWLEMLPRFKTSTTDNTETKPQTILQ